ncbi:MAG: YihY/virulence factor BrkB family protein [Bryobacteraceae bacterium]|nr:YihY/virulence factor BrkB family protein [Bryobacteraceae bacterium]
MARFWRRLGRALWSAANDGCLAAAKGAAYSALLAIFPVLSTVTAIFAQVQAQRTADTLARLLFTVAPSGTEELLEHTLTSRGERPILLLILAGLLSVVAASGVILSLIDGFQAAYRTPNRRGFWRNRLIAMGLVVFVALPLLGISALVVVTGSGAYLIASFVAVVLMTLILYRFGPDRPRDREKEPVWPGAILASFLWLASTAGFVFYVRNLANYNVIYGSIAAVIALLVWLYLLSASVLIGCEYNAVRERELNEG